MRKTIIISGKNWREEDKKISEMIYQRYQEILKQNKSMVITEAYLQAVCQLMNEEKIPLLILK
ncbi:hypothetical protein II906_00060 [bacterium]|nr:hypothetical protein [bacterium]